MLKSAELQLGTFPIEQWFGRKVYRRIGGQKVSGTLIGWATGTTFWYRIAHVKEPVQVRLQDLAPWWAGNPDLKAIYDKKMEDAERLQPLSTVVVGNDSGQEVVVAGTDVSMQEDAETKALLAMYEEDEKRKEVERRKSFEIKSLEEQCGVQPDEEDSHITPDQPNLQAPDERELWVLCDLKNRQIWGGPQFRWSGDFAYAQRYQQTSVAKARWQVFNSTRAMHGRSEEDMSFLPVSEAKILKWGGQYDPGEPPLGRTPEQVLNPPKLEQLKQGLEQRQADMTREAQSFTVNLTVEDLANPDLMQNLTKMSQAALSIKSALETLKRAEASFEESKKEFERIRIKK